MAEAGEEGRSSGNPSGAVSSRLEDILADTRRPYGARVRAGALVELATLAKLAAPAVMVYLILITNITSGVAVGCGWQAFVAYINIGCYYVVGIPLGCVLGFRFGYGVKGLWSEMLAGILAQTLILSWIILRTNWIQEVETA